MATTETTAFGDGTTILFSFPFPYLKTEDIKVELQRYDSTQTSGNEIISRQTISAFTVPSNNPTAVQFSAVTESDYQESTGAPKLNFGSTTDTVRVRVFRFTDADSIPSTFIQGSSIRAQDLNNNFEQTLYIMQERQNTIEAIQLGGIGENVISTSALQDDAVTADKLRDSIADDTQRSVTTNHIRNDAITTPKIINDAVTTPKIINDAVTTDKIINDAVTTDKIINDAVTSAKIADGTILNINVNTAAAIDGTKISPDFGAQNIITTGSVGGSTATFSGDVLQYTTLKTPYYLREPDFDAPTSTTQKIYDIPTWANRFVVNMDNGAVTGSNVVLLVQFGSATAFWNHTSTFVNNPSSAISAGSWIFATSPFPTGSGVTTAGFALGLVGFAGWYSSSHVVFMKMFDRWSSSGTFQYENIASPTVSNRGSGKIFTNPVDFIDTPTRIRIIGNALNPIAGKFGVTWFSE